MKEIARGKYGEAARDINEQGTIVGRGKTGPNSYEAYRYSLANGIQRLGTLGGDNYSGATSINNHGVIAGNSNRTIFLFNDEFGMLPIQVLNLPPDYELRGAPQINDQNHLISGFQGVPLLLLPVN